MKKSDALKQKRTALLKRWNSLVKLAQKEKRGLTTDENADIKKWRSKMEVLDESIDNHTDLEKRLARKAKSNGKLVPGAGEGTGKSEEREHSKMLRKYSLHKALRSQMGNGKLDGVEKEIHDETVKRAAKAGIAIGGIALPSPMQRADGQTVTEDAGDYGGKLVDTEQKGVIEFLRPQPKLRTLGARFLPGLTSNLTFPVSEGGITASWEGEISKVAKTKNKFVNKEMKPKRLAVSTLLSLQNIMQSTPSLESMTVSDMRSAIEQAIDIAGINGSGAGNVPLGVLNAPNTNALAVGTNGGLPTWDHIVDMETSVFVENANAAKMAYYINSGTQGRLKKTPHGADGLGYLMDKKNMINNYPVGVGNLMPSDLTKGTSAGICNAAIFGDFSQLIIGQWGFYDMSVDDKTLIDEGQIKITFNTFLDVLLRQSKAFSVLKDWTL